MTMNNMENDKNNESTDNRELFAYYNDISRLFKKIKSKGILDKKIVIDTYEVADERLLDSGDFMDKVIYHRIKKHYTPSSFARKLGLDRDTYYQYENGIFKLHNVEIVKKIVRILEMSEEDIPDYIKFIINDPIEQIKTFMKKYNISRKQFSENSKISMNTFNRWFVENGQISIKNFNKLKAYMGDEI